jgi:hypothetical protein
MTVRSTLAAIALLAVTCAAASAQTNPLVGAWQRMSDINAAGIQQQPPAPAAFLILSADGFYSQTAIPEGRAKVNKPLDQMTKEELVARFDRVTDRRGTYTIVGNKLTRHDISNTNPGAEGGDQIQLFRIEGDVMILTTEDPKSKAEVRFRRAKKTT